MPKVIPDIVTAELEGDFVLFLVGMRINNLWKVHRWLPVLLAVLRMLRELQRHKETGFLGYFGAGGLRSILAVEYWRSFEHLRSYAHSEHLAHWPAWKAFNRRAASSRDDVGIWHETYLAHAGEYETIYRAMPPFGLGAVGTLAPAKGRMASATGRLGARLQPDQPVGNTSVSAGDVKASVDR